MDSQKLKELKDLKKSFIEEFPLESLKTMPIEKYANRKRNSFCHWLEFLTPGLGAIGGGSSYKFFIFEYNKRPEFVGGKFLCDDKYAWLKSIGTDRDKVYEIVRDRVYRIAKYASEGKLSLIDDIYFGTIVKWKIAYMYSSTGIVPVYSEQMLKSFANKLGMADVENRPISELQSYLYQACGSEDPLSVMGKLCDEYNMKNDMDNEQGENEIEPGSIRISGNHTSEQMYTVNHYMVTDLLTFIQTGEIAIPEIQRPFVWEPDKVTKLIDSLYSGFPIGYIVTWKGPNIRLKNGSTSEGKKIIIDGQQRITALRAALMGETVKNKDYKDNPIQVAYNPLENRFTTYNPAIGKDRKWIKDIAPLFNGKIKASAMRREYCKLNPEINEDDIEEIIDSLKDISKKQIGVIELSGGLDIEKVTEIFIRINSEGVPLNQADFVMSTIAANEDLGGPLLRKCIDHFSELAVRPEFYPTLVKNDEEFAKSDYCSQIEWLKQDNEDIYDPSYVDVLRVAFTSKFSRGRMSDLVSLLSGRNFETREFEQKIKEDTYFRLAEGVKAFINETNFKRFVMIIRSAGFCSPKLIRSHNALNFAYILYLKLREQKYDPSLIEKYVRRWFVFSILRGRYSSAPESAFDFDIKQVGEGKDFGEYLSNMEAAELSDAFWSFGLVQQLNTSVASSPIFNVFLASQCKENRKGFLSTAITVRDMIEEKGDVHHIFPKEYLKSCNIPRSMYNQVANYVYAQTEINIKIGKKAPNDYLRYVRDVQCKGGDAKYGSISSFEVLSDNLLNDCCIPLELADMTVDRYNEFLEKRRALIAARLKKYYFSL